MESEKKRMGSSQEREECGSVPQMRVSGLGGGHGGREGAAAMCTTSTGDSARTPFGVSLLGENSGAEGARD